MINTYDFQVEHPEMFSHLSVKDLLFLHYKCPQEERMVNLYTHFNKFIFVLEGKKMIHHAVSRGYLILKKQVFLERLHTARKGFKI